MNRDQAPRRLLFLGNSHTYTHNVPKLMLELANAAGYRNHLHIAMNAESRVGLEWHRQNSRSLDLISCGRWDYVVLQERSGGALEDKNKMFTNARLLDEEIGKTDSKTAFYMTWASRNDPGMQKTITDAYQEISGELGATLVPVGCAWENALTSNPDLSLYEADGRHATILGAYLAACVFFAVFYGVSPEGLPGTLSDQGIPLCSLPTSQSLFLQRSAFETVLKGEGDGITGGGRKHPTAAD